ncbi:MAG: TetR/AcrR family transcriptional regulator [Treponema sp.]|jgi:AcrR family transcriptional regulator|nr:TetR/AcrR family transcriptional regulator [Treponema sp.]
MTKQDIVKAALRVWAREFYTNTSLSKVARELGVSKPALYRHFENKEALFKAMQDYFFDDYVAHVKPGLKQAMAIKDIRESMLVVIRVLADYFARNEDLFIFALIKVYGNRKQKNMTLPMRERGLDMEAFNCNYSHMMKENPSRIQMITSTIILWMANFHKEQGKRGEKPGEEQIRSLIVSMEKWITVGLGLNRELIDRMDYERLEDGVSGLSLGAIDDGDLIKAVASVVAEDGPWNASMEMVAQRSGLSKSGLYAHFKSKQDMMRQLFMTEFSRIIAFAGEGIRQSEVPEEQLYLGLYSITSYLRQRPEILAALDWIRTRRLDLGRMDPPPPHFFSVFRNIRLPIEDWSSDKVPGEADEPFGDSPEDLIDQWILFLTLNMLMHRPEGMAFADFPNSSIRVLYRFITLGLRGYIE